MEVYETNRDRLGFWLMSLALLALMLLALNVAREHLEALQAEKMAELKSLITLH